MKCKSCVYRFSDHKKTACGYILATGEPRGCPAGKDCDKYKCGRSYAKAAAFGAVKKERRQK